MTIAVITREVLLLPACAQLSCSSVVTLRVMSCDLESNRRDNHMLTAESNPYLLPRWDKLHALALNEVSAIRDILHQSRYGRGRQKSILKSSSGYESDEQES